jgi:hypothetical protein
MLARCRRFGASAHVCCGQACARAGPWRHRPAGAGVCRLFRVCQRPMGGTYSDSARSVQRRHLHRYASRQVTQAAGCSGAGAQFPRYAGHAGQTTGGRLLRERNGLGDNRAGWVEGARVLVGPDRCVVRCEATAGADRQVEPDRGLGAAFALCRPRSSRSAPRDSAGLPGRPRPERPRRILQERRACARGAGCIPDVSRAAVDPLRRAGGGG